jgi:hypothetical protein
MSAQLMPLAGGAGHHIRDTTALVRAHRWRLQIESGRAKSITDLAGQEGITPSVSSIAASDVEGLVLGQVTP